ncbi:MAG: hypothetical protein LUH10_18490 [Tannerellaceae bacterium]|nr:hypothetical protein [Tannerellaceae bacterium]
MNGTHTCPFFTTTESELAVYALQKIHRKNWYDFPPFREYKDKSGTSSRDNHQQWLQDLLYDPETRTQLAGLWLSCTR